VPLDPESLKDGFRGALLGTLVGDALGAPVRGWKLERIAREVGEVREMLGGKHARGRYGDDSQMMVAVAEWLLEDGETGGSGLASRLLAAYDPVRGYGRGSTDVMRRLRAGESWDTAADHVFPRGSFSSAAAARIAPVAALFHDDAEALANIVEQSALVTNTHPLGIGGAALQARQMALALSRRGETLDPIGVSVELRSTEPTSEFRQKLRAVEECVERKAPPSIVRDRLGCNSTALGSVATALYCFLSRLESFEAAVAAAASLGGDSDSIAAMTGAIAGAHHGASAIPARWRAALEEGAKGAAYVERLADRLWERHRERHARTR
jgi:poly(ADP-ribose) glycohydrolase ARH3